MRTVLALAIGAVFACAIPARADDVPTAREGASYVVPLYGTVIAGWDAPDDNPFAAGHRGVDVAAPLGSPVRASAAGTVVFAGLVAGNLTVSIDHPDGVRSTYSYLASTAVKRNEHVEQGQLVGSVGHGHPGSNVSHVHLSMRRSGVYFDPLPVYVGSSYADLIALVA